MGETRILIAVDDSALLESLANTLRRRLDVAYVDTSDSAHATLDQLGEQTYDALAVDVEMADMTSVDLLDAVKQHQADTAILVIADARSHELAVQALRGGAYDVITKPIDEEYFVSSIGRAIECRRLSREVARKRLELLRHTEELEACLQQRAIELREALHREQSARTELDEAHRGLEELMRQRENFVSTVAHELATPLSTIQGYAEQLGRSPTSPGRQERACAVIVSEAGRLMRLVNDLTDPTQIPVGPFRTEAAPCDLAQLTREQVELAQAFTSQHTIDLDAPATLPITGDCDRLAQALSNLLSNAIKHTPGGAIEVALRDDGGQAFLSVHDSGPGMPRELAEALFEPDRRVGDAEQHGSPAYVGFGLRTVKAIVEAHTGRIWVETTEGQGSTFWVALPLVTITSSEAPKA